MKISFRLFAALGLCVMVGTSLVSAAHAAPDAPKMGGPMGGKMGGPGMGGPGGRMRGGGMRGMGRMTKGLNLTDAQKLKVKAMMEASMPQMKALRDNKSMTPAQKMTKMKAMREANMKKMNAILTPAQRTQMQAMMKERRENRPGKM